MTDKELEQFEYNTKIQTEIERIELNLNDIEQNDKLNIPVEFSCIFKQLATDNNALVFNYDQDDIITHDMITRAMKCYLNTIKESLI
jgi:hypothetical protein